MEENRVALLHREGLAQEKLHRQTLQRHRRGGLEVDVVGDLDQPVGRQDALLGVGALRPEIGDPVAWFHMRHAGADGDHGAGALARRA